MRVLQRMPLAVLVTMLLVGPSFAQDQTKDKTKGGEKERPARTAEDKGSAELPQFLMKVDLTPEQEQKIRKAVQTHNKETQKVWSEFHRLHWQAVELEAILSAANRLADHDHEAHQQKTKDGQAKAPKTFAGEDQNERKSASENKDKKAKGKRSQGKQAKSPKEKTQNQKPSDRERRPQGVEQADLNILGMRIAVLKPDGSVREIRLAGNVEPREEQCEICQEHKQQLKTLWQKIHQLHGRLVEIEADHMTNVESMLTEKQLEQLEKAGKEKSSESREDQSPEKSQSGARNPNQTRKE